jgi:hypothetical protein
MENGWKYDEDLREHGELNLIASCEGFMLRCSATGLRHGIGN